jgi:hypothetical protein
MSDSGRLCPSTKSLRVSADIAAGPTYNVGVRRAATLSAMPIGAGTRKPPSFAALLLFGSAAVIVLVVHLATNGTLGFHTDELYYIDSGR